MAIITFISDYGNKDHYVAAVKAKIISHNPELRIVDISHNIEHYNLAHGSFILKSVFREFPLGTVHLAAVDETSSSRFIALALEGHYFIGADNGLFALISDKAPGEIVELPSATSTFPSLTILAEASARVASGEPLQAIGQPTTEYRQLIGRQVRATKKQISGHVIRVDHYGNLITNIEKKVFDLLSDGKDYSIVFGREKFKRFNQSYHETEAGDCFVLFNSLGLLEIGINNGNANELLGQGFDSPVNILFSE
jgi:S-adenosyl-L-methionine hydrolase (adenosine-forming)